MNNFYDLIAKGEVHLNDNNIDISNLEWNLHPAFKGVYLKHLIKGDQANNRLSMHIVRIEKKCEIANHRHDNKLEVHTVIGGIGKLLINNKTIDYYPGICTIIPDNTDHIVKALDEDLYIIAEFCSALI